MRLVRRKLISSCSIRRISWERTVIGLSTLARKPRFDNIGHDDFDRDDIGDDGLGRHDTDALWGRRRRAGGLLGEAAAALRSVESQASIAHGSCSNRAA